MFGPALHDMFEMPPSANYYLILVPNIFVK